MPTHPSFAARILGSTFAVVACAPHDPPPEQNAVVAEEPAPTVTRVAPVPEPLELDRRAAPTASVAGTVRDLTGVGLVGAQVCAWNIDPHAVDPAPRCVTTDASGAYALTGLVAARHEVHAGARDYQPGRTGEPLALQPGERRTGVDIRLAAGGVLVSGIVRSTRGGPIAGAWVSNFDHDEPGPSDARRGAAVATRTDAAGHFELWLTAGPQTLAAHAEGFARAEGQEIAAPGRYTLTRTPEAQLTGQVVDTRGAAIAGARVSATIAGLEQRAGLAYTGADGRYTISGLDAGQYRLVAEAPRRRGQAEHMVYLGPAATASPPAITLRPVANVTGRLLIAGIQQTCPLGQVTLHGQDGTQRVEHARPGGEVVFPAVPPGVYAVRAECPGAVAPPEFPMIEMQAEPVRDVAWEFAIGRTIRGTIVDARGRPLVGVRARAYPAGSDCGGACAGPSQLRAGDRCQTDDQCAMDEICDNGQCAFTGSVPRANLGTSHPSDATGHYVISGLPPGAYEVVAIAATRTDPKPLQANVAEHDVDDLVLTGSPQTRLGGVVRDEQGAPVPRAQVSLLADRGMHLVPTASARTDDDGRFTLFDVGPGDYRLRALLTAARDDEATKPRPGDVRTRIRPDEPGELPLRLSGARTEIRGQVQGPDGKPAPDVIVDARLATPGDDAANIRSMLRAGAADHTTRSDADGMFTLGDLPRGSYTLRAHAGGGAEAVREGVRGDVRPTLVLPPALAIAGRLTGATIPESFNIRIQAHDGELLREEMFSHTAGRWAFEGLAAGTYELHHEDTERRGFLVVVLGEQPQTGLELAVAPTGSVPGRAVDAELGTPLAGIQVRAQVPGPALRFAAWPLETVTDDDGRFEFPGMPAGPLVLTFPAYSPNTLEATATPGSTAEITARLTLKPTPEHRRGR